MRGLSFSFLTSIDRSSFRSVDVKDRQSMIV